MRIRTVLFVAGALAALCIEGLTVPVAGAQTRPTRPTPPTIRATTTTRPPTATTKPATATTTTSRPPATTSTSRPAATTTTTKPPTASPALAPTPRDEAAAAAAGLQAGPNPAFASRDGGTAVPYSYSVARVFATQYQPNTPGSVEVALPDKCVKFAATGNTAALAAYQCAATYGLGLDYRVVVFADNGRSAVLPVRDVGPWNTDDNYFDFGLGAPRPRRLFGDLPATSPESQNAFYAGYNNQPNCLHLDGTPAGHSGGSDQFNRCVLNPAGIDLSVNAAAALGLGAGQNQWVTVAYLWEPMRNTVSSASTGMVIDTVNALTTPGAPLIQNFNYLSASQLWRFDLVGPDTYRIMSASTGLVLDVNAASTADGAPIIQWNWTGGTNQLWRFENVGGTNFRIVSVASGKVLDVANASQSPGAQLIQWPWNGGANQQWNLNVVGTG